MALSDKVRELSNLLKTDDLKTCDLAQGISDLIGCNTYLVNSEGEITGQALPLGNDCTERGNGKPIALKSDFKQRLGFIFQTTANIQLEGCFLNDGDCCIPNIYITIVPIRNAQASSWHMLLTKHGQAFNDEELTLAEASALAAGLFFYESVFSGSDADLRQKSNAQLVLDSLSFSELRAISNVFGDLNGVEGFLVASKIADRIGISRSVIVNAMRKLESAGVVDSRSLGIKGTYIKIKNEYFLDLLKDRVQ